MLIDQFSDSQHRLLFQLKREFPREVVRAKTASLSEEDMPKHKQAYANVAAKRFPLHTAEHALLSKMYAVKQASLVDPCTMGRIDKALALYGIEWAPTVAEKQASDRASHYLLPQHNALLVKEAAHVPVVAKALLDQRYKLTHTSVAQASTALVKKAAEFGMTITDLPVDVYKYAGLTTCDAGVLVDWVEARACAAPTTALRDDYTKIAQFITKNLPGDGIIRDRADLVKIASIIERIDTDAEFPARYGIDMLDPLETVFNMDKISESTITLAGNPVPMSKVRSLPDSVFEDTLGADVMEHATVDGQVDPEQLKALLETLPADLQNILYTNLKAYL